MASIQDIDPALTLLSPRVDVQKSIDDSEDFGGIARLPLLQVSDVISYYPYSIAEVIRSTSNRRGGTNKNVLEKMRVNKTKLIEQFIGDEDLFLADLTVIIEVPLISACVVCSTLIRCV